MDLTAPKGFAARGSTVLWSQRAGQFANDAVLNAEILHFLSIRGWRWRRRSGWFNQLLVGYRPVFQLIEQAVEGRVCELHLSSSLAIFQKATRAFSRV